MDDILASIRRIIADDQPGHKAASRSPDPDTGERVDEAAGYPDNPEPAPATPDEPFPEPGSGDVPPLMEGTPDDADPWPVTAASTASEPDRPQAEAPFPSPPTRPTVAPARPVLHRIEPVFAPPPTPAEPVRHQPSFTPEGAGPDSLLSQAATASVGDAFQALSHTVLSTNSRTLEDLVKDMLRPMLQGWLDDNLPPLVERLVRAEIERVARGRS